MCRTERKSGMTALTIESPAEGEKVTLVGVGVKDDPLSQELMQVLQGAPRSSALRWRSTGAAAAATGTTGW